MRPTRKQIREQIKELQELQKVAESQNDVVLSRMAYMVSENLRWSIEDTEDWAVPYEDVILHAKTLKEELLK